MNNYLFNSDNNSMQSSAAQRKKKNFFDWGATEHREVLSNGSHSWEVEKP